MDTRVEWNSRSFSYGLEIKYRNAPSAALSFGEKMRTKMAFHLFKKTCRRGVEMIYDAINRAFNTELHSAPSCPAQIHVDQWEEPVRAGQDFPAPYAVFEEFHM